MGGGSLVEKGLVTSRGTRRAPRGVCLVADGVGRPAGPADPRSTRRKRPCIRHVRDERDRRADANPRARCKIAFETPSRIVAAVERGRRRLAHFMISASCATSRSERALLSSSPRDGAAFDEANVSQGLVRLLAVTARIYSRASSTRASGGDPPAVGVIPSAMPGMSCRSVLRRARSAAFARWIASWRRRPRRPNAPCAGPPHEPQQHQVPAHPAKGSPCA